jgi:cyclopropane fatty-acyl-phospholipid synthase-like methyltransferase
MSRSSTWRGWWRYWSASKPDPALHYDLRGDTTMTSWLRTPLANMGLWDDVDPSDPDGIENANKALFDMVAADARIEHGDRVLDAGAGFGVNAIRIADRHDVRVTGVNVSKVQTDIAIRLIHEAGHEDQIELLVADATQLPIPDETVDRVVSVEAAFHFDDRSVFFAEALRVLVPGGRLSLVDLVPLPPRGPVGRAAARLMARSLAIPAGNFYSIDDYARLVEQSGFIDVTSESIHDQTYRPFRRWVWKTVFRQMRGKHPAFALPSMVYLFYPVDYIRLTASKPPVSAT